ncbi:unnamed protein product, partial [Phaeothamnion confervicola]
IDRKHFKDPSDEKQVEKSFKERGYSFGVFEDPQGREWRDFTHGGNELVVVKEGRM